MITYRTTRNQAGGDRWGRRLNVAVATTALTITLTACGDSDSEADGEAGLAGTLDRVAATETTMPYIEYGHTERITEASGGSFQGMWGSLDGWGQSQMFSYRNNMRLVLDVDVAEATSVLTVGQEPSSITLVRGGQDENAITSAATGAGWSGEDVLTWGGSMMPPTGPGTPKVRPLSSDVALGGEETDLSVVDSSETSLAEDPLLSGLTSCLGDVIAALVVTGDSTSDPVAAGIRKDDEDPDVPLSVMCVSTGSDMDAQALAASIEEAIASGQSSLNDLPYSELFSSPEVEVLEDGSLVRMTALNTPEAFAHTILQMTRAGELPGLPSSS